VRSTPRSRDSVLTSGARGKPVTFPRTPTSTLRRSYALALHIVRNHPSSVSEQTPWQREIFIVLSWLVGLPYSSCVWLVSQKPQPLILMALRRKTVKKGLCLPVEELITLLWTQPTSFTIHFLRVCLSGQFISALRNLWFHVGTLLLAGLALSGLFTGSAESSSGYGQQYGYQQKQGQGQGQGQGGFARNKRYAEGFTDQLNLLAEAFHKYEIDETNGCQLYVACESSDVAMHRKNGPLAKTVYQAMK